MCRLAAYIGPPVALSHVIVEPSHSLLEQSIHATEAKLAVQGDGFGFAWYDHEQHMGLYRDVLPAWSDGNLLSLCRMIRSPLFLAHVRASTSGETSRVNCHPFAHGDWCFMHNGQVPRIEHIRRPLESTLPDDLYAARRGTTDSELIFLLLLANGLREDPLSAVRTVIDLLHSVSLGHPASDAIRMTCVLSDGDTLYAFRHASDMRAPTLYLKQLCDGGRILASEPLEPTRDGWITVGMDQFVTITGNDPEFADLFGGCAKVA